MNTQGGLRPVVIVVDADHAVRNSLEFSLGIEGFAVRPYGSARELLAPPGPPVCACFVIDQNMPDMSGLDLLNRLRQLGISTPAILTTTYPNAILLEDAIRQGILIVEKPLLGNTLLEYIRTICRAAAASDPPPS